MVLETAMRILRHDLRCREEGTAPVDQAACIVPGPSKSCVQLLFTDLWMLYVGLPPPPPSAKCLIEIKSLK
jgi:hypothetical protein